MIDKSGFGKRLEDAMKAAGYTNTALTEKTGFSKNVIGNYIHNESKLPTAENIYILSQILGTTMEYLLTGKESGTLTPEEKEVLEAYRAAAPGMKNAARKLLDLPEIQGKSSDWMPGEEVI